VHESRFGLGEVTSGWKTDKRMDGARVEGRFGVGDAKRSVSTGLRQSTQGFGRDVVTRKTVCETLGSLRCFCACADHPFVFLHVGA